jgi:hypothetical protein
MGASGSIVARPTESDLIQIIFYSYRWILRLMNTQTLKYTLVAYAVAAATYNGRYYWYSTLGWDNSTALTQSTFNAHVWSLNVLGLVDGS